MTPAAWAFLTALTAVCALSVWVGLRWTHYGQRRRAS